MTAIEPSTLYSLPAAPSGLNILVNDIGAHLSWNANQELDVTGYHIYRSTDNNLTYQLITENVDAVTYSDPTIKDTNVYYYKIAAVDAQDISFDSNEVVTGVLVNEIPGLLQAENWTDMNGFEVEMTSDTDGGRNTGFADPGDWLEYRINIATAGNYLVAYRLATQTGSDGFTLTVNGSLIDSVVVQSTGGWQTWATQTSTVALPTGEHTLRIDSIGGAWNLNWLKFSVTP